MKEQNIILEKSYAFDLRIVKLYMHLGKQKVERELLIQLLKSGTSIGANIEEAVGAQSKSDFIHKVSIAYKESVYQLRIKNSFNDRMNIILENRTSLIKN